MGVVTDTLLTSLSPQMMLYSTNLALLFGAKTIGLYEYFSLMDERSGVWYADGLVDSMRIPNNRYYMIKNTIAPRLKGLFGKTLKQALQTLQMTGLSAYPFANVNHGYVKKIVGYPLESNRQLYDIGFFKENPSSNNEAYFMLLKRYYSDNLDVTIHLQNLSWYKNWRVTEIVKNIDHYLIPVNNTAYFTDLIAPGDAELYSIFPAVKQGGKIQTNETISTPESLQGELTIENGAMLTINNSYNVYADITH